MKAEEDKLIIGGKEHNSRLLHCFGINETHKLTPEQALELIDISGTDFLTVYTQGALSIDSAEDLPIGYSGIKYKDIKKRTNKKLTLLVNTNHALTSEEAVKKAEHVSKLTGSKLIKLEVLNKELTRPVNERVIHAAQELRDKGYEVMPFITRDLESAKKLEDMGCCAIRFLMNDIRSEGGFQDEEFFRRAVSEINIPLIGEGGVKSPEDCFRLMSIGMSATLINTALFTANNPRLFMISTREAVRAGRLVYLNSLSGRKNKLDLNYSVSL